MRNELKQYIKAYCKLHNMKISKGKPDQYKSKSWKIRNSWFGYYDKITIAFNRLKEMRDEIYD